MEYPTNYTPIILPRAYALIVPSTFSFIAFSLNHIAIARLSDPRSAIR